MIIDDSDLMGVRRLPAKDDAPAAVDSDAVEALEIPFEDLEAISRRRPKIPQIPRGVQHVQPLRRGPEYLGRVAPNPAGLAIVEEVFRRLVAKGGNHSGAALILPYHYPGIRESR